MKTNKFNDLIAEHRLYVLNLVHKFVNNREYAEDIVQDAIVKILLSDGPRELKVFRTWFCAIALNIARNKYRSPGHDRFREELDLRFLGAEINDLDFKIDAEKMKSRITRFMDTLPKRQKQAFEMRLIDDMNFREMAEIMNCAYDTAKGNYLHAFSKFRAHMIEAGHVEAGQI